jgi:hypothetical protein
MRFQRMDGWMDNPSLAQRMTLSPPIGSSFLPHLYSAVCVDSNHFLPKNFISK